jgi:hypothetical protein
MIKKIIQVKKNLNKLNSLLEGNGHTTCGGYTTLRVGKTIPERWCPEISPKVKSQDLPPILSKNVVNIDGGSP